MAQIYNVKEIVKNMPFEELEGSPRMKVKRGKITAEMDIKIAWNLVSDFLSLIFPAPYVSGNLIIIPPPACYPGFRWLFADSVSIDPFDPNSPKGDLTFPNTYDGGARIKIEFTTPEWDVNPQSTTNGIEPITMVTQKISTGGEFVTWPSLGLQWERSGDWAGQPFPGEPANRNSVVIDDVQASMMIPIIEHETNWQYVPYPPWKAIRACIGKVNAYPIFGAMPETLLFLGAEAHREITTNGLRMWNMTYKFAEKNMNPNDSSNPQGWNHYLRPDGPSAGQFMRLKKRMAGGMSVLVNTVTSLGTSIVVREPDSFPIANGGAFPFYVRIGGNDDVTVSSGLLNTWTVSPVSRTHNPGESVVQLMRTSLTGTVNPTQAFIAVESKSVFPRFGQFIVRMQNEMCAVVAGHGTGQGTYVVLRGVMGTSADTHLAGTAVTLDGAPIYELAPFATLYRSGLSL